MRSFSGLLLFFIFSSGKLFAQPMAQDSFYVHVILDGGDPANGATVELNTASDRSLVRTGITDKQGKAAFFLLPAGNYQVTVNHIGFTTQTSASFQFPSITTTTITLKPLGGTMQNVVVTGKKAFIQHTQGKVIVNPEASITNAGTTVLEVLEKSPGVTVDRNGGISLQAKAGVLILIDDKPTYLSGTDLVNMLNSMSSSQVEQIELMVNPPAKYDASGNAGIINIKTKKTRLKGFNGSFTIAAGQGFYPKNNNSLVMNYRNGRFNHFLTYSMNINKYLSDIYALRRYFDGNGNVTAILDQPTFYNGKSFNNTLKTGLDYFISDKTTVGLTINGTLVNRKGKGDASAIWLDPSGGIDSIIATYSNSSNHFRNGGINLNLRHTINKGQDIGIDVDRLAYDIDNDQYFNNKLLVQGGYDDASQGKTLGTIDIFSIKADHSIAIGKEGKLESGWKSSRIRTDNEAIYQMYDGTAWWVDYGKTNHFIYTEHIHAVYSSLQQKFGKLSFQAGLRYENTGYEANQLGNPFRKDSVFDRKYSGLFPSGYLSYELDSSNTISLTAGRRIDRPAFQKLNPFVFIINKYTHQTGNAFIVPQYSWNMELSHNYKNWLNTTVSYSILKNYFSQLFLTDSSDILIYSEGNVGKVHNLGISVGVQASPLKWWTVNANALYNHKELKGFLGKAINTDISQFNFSMNNQLKLGKTYAAEIAGSYTGRARNDLQEVLYPTGQLSLGLSRPVLKKKGTLKLSMRDIFYTQAMEGLTDFTSSDEYFIIKRDSRVVNLAFTYRFGKAFKAVRRSNGGASDEMQRAGNGN